MYSIVKMHVALSSYIMNLRFKINSFYLVFKIIPRDVILHSDIYNL